MVWCLLVWWRPAGRGWVSRWAPGHGHAAALVDQRLDQPGDVPQRGVEQAGDVRHRRDDRTHGLGEEDLARRECREPADAVRVDRPRPQHAARDLHDLERASGVQDGLGGRRLVGAEGDGRRSGEERRQGLGRGVVLRGDAHQAVLDDAKRHVLLVQRAPDLADLLHREAAILGHDQRAAGVQLRAQIADGLALGLGRHVPP
jgi:hypothetical protein